MIDDTHPKRCLLPLWKPVLFSLLLIGLSGCAVQEVKEEKKPVVQTSEEVGRLEKIIGHQKTTIMQLELQLLAGQSEIQRLSAAQEQAIQEIVRLKSKLRTRNSKAETVANLAEVKLALQGTMTKGSRDNRGEGLERAWQYIAMSEVALEKGNYGGASYLISQAKNSLRTSTGTPDDRSEGKSNVNSFSLPVRMTVKKRSNVRAGPGTGTNVLIQLNTGASVLATGYRDLWVRIQRKDKNIGWIHYSLLRADQ